MKTFEVITFGWVEAESLEQAEELYAEGEWLLDYHEIEELIEDTK